VLPPGASDARLPASAAVRKEVLTGIFINRFCLWPYSNSSCTKNGKKYLKGCWSSESLNTVIKEADGYTGLLRKSLLLLVVAILLQVYSSSQSCRTATGTHRPYGITLCYLPSDRGDTPALTLAKAGTRFSDPEGCKAELTCNPVDLHHHQLQKSVPPSWRVGCSDCTRLMMLPLNG